MQHKIRSLNELVATKATALVGTMACVYVFTVWSVLPLIVPSTRDLVFYVSGGILQLVLLPIMMVASSILSRASEDRAKQDHQALMEELDSIRNLVETQAEELLLLRAIHSVVVIEPPR